MYRGGETVCHFTFTSDVSLTHSTRSRSFIFQSGKRAHIYVNWALATPRSNGSFLFCVYVKLITYITAFFFVFVVAEFISR